MNLEIGHILNATRLHSFSFLSIVKFSSASITGVVERRQVEKRYRIPTTCETPAKNPFLPNIRMNPD